MGLLIGLRFRVSEKSSSFLGGDGLRAPQNEDYQKTMGAPYRV